MVRAVCTLALTPVLCIPAGCYDIVEAVDDDGMIGSYGEVTYDPYDSWYTSGYDAYDEEDYWVEEDWCYDEYTAEWCFYDWYYEAWYCGTDDYYDDAYGNGWLYDDLTGTWCHYDLYYDEWYCEDGNEWP